MKFSTVGTKGEEMARLGVKWGFFLPSDSVEPSVEIHKETPNFSQRTVPVSAIVLHNTEGDFDGSVSWLCNREAKASAHLVISRTGKTAKLLGFGQRAWHAGTKEWNDKSIGIELEAYAGAEGMTAAQEGKLLEWLRYLMAEYKINKENITIHRRIVETDCPSRVWPTDGLFDLWLSKNVD